MASIDLKDAYYSVPIKASDCKLASFKWKEQIYHYLSPQWLILCSQKIYQDKKACPCTFACERPYICCPFGWSLFARSNIWRLYQECDWNYLATWKIGFYSTPYKVSFGAYSEDSFSWFCHKLVDFDCDVDKGESSQFKANCLGSLKQPFDKVSWGYAWPIIP